MNLKTLLSSLIILLMASCDPPKKQESKAADKTFNVLLFTKTEGFRHESIKQGIIAIKQLAYRNNFDITQTEDAYVFSAEELATYDVIIFLSTTGDILNEDQQKVMEGFIRSGKGFVGIHAATDTEYDWPWYNGLVGAYFSNHPPGIHAASISKTGKSHISTAMLPPIWKRTDEWYNFKSVHDDINVILNLDEESYEGGEMGPHHPIAWFHEYDGGRSWYTAGGHTKESFSEKLFLQHIEKGIMYAAGVE